MKILLDVKKSVQENAAHYYEEAKAAKKKREGLEKAIAETEQQLENARKKPVARPAMKIKREKKWYEKFHWFFTSEGKLAVGGKSAQENDRVVARHMEESDLFFHADIQGGSAVILKNGVQASTQEKQEAAQFAASFSNAWKNANAGVDVYAVRKDQLGKHVSGGYVGAGGFAIAGEREWFRNTPLGLKIGKSTGETVEASVLLLPVCSPQELKVELQLVASGAGKEKGELAKGLAKRLGVSVDELLGILPSGKTKTKI